MGRPKKVQKKTVKKVAKKIAPKQSPKDKIIAQLENERDYFKEALLAVPIDSQNWIRGKLPGGELIKIHRDTGKHYAVDQSEWDSLR